MKFEYVMSGTSMARFPQSTQYQENIDIFNTFIKDLPYNFSLLFNAYTEPKFGDLYQVYKNSLHELHADSGGLQIVTLGLPKNEVKKKQKEIYKIQSLKSTIAMCFDEIPVEIIGSGGGSSRTDLSKRFFVHENIQKTAKATAENLKQQIEIFNNNNSTSKIMIISHGNTNETYKEYVETICNNLTDDELKYIYGVAPSSASNGLGGVERFDMLYGIKQYNIPEHIKSNIHLLGVGSYSGLIPLVHSTNYFSFVNNCSFDSSSHARRYSIDGEGFNKKFIKSWSPTEYIPEYLKVFKYYEKYFKMLRTDITVNDLIEKSTYYSKHNNKGIWYYSTEELEAKIMKTFLSTFIPFYQINKLMNKLLVKTPNNLLNSIKTYDDYLYHKPTINMLFNLKSNKVKSYNTIKEMKNSIETNNFIKDLF